MSAQACCGAVLRAAGAAGRTVSRGILFTVSFVPLSHSAIPQACAARHLAANLQPARTLQLVYGVQQLHVRLCSFIGDRSAETVESVMVA